MLGSVSLPFEVFDYLLTILSAMKFGGMRNVDLSLHGPSRKRMDREVDDLFSWVLDASLMDFIINISWVVRLYL